MASVELRKLLEAFPSLATTPIEVPIHLRARFGLATIQLGSDGRPRRGQRVQVSPEHNCKSLSCVGKTYELHEVQDRAGQFFVSLRDPGTGLVHKWHRADELIPVPTPPTPSARIMDDQKEDLMSAVTINAASAFAAAVVREIANGTSALDAIHLVQDRDAAGAKAYRLVGIGVDELKGEPRPVLSLSVKPTPGESFDAVVDRYAAEHHVSLREAIHAVGLARPDLIPAR